MANVILSRQLQIQCRGWQGISRMLQKSASISQTRIQLLTTGSSMKFLGDKSNNLFATQNKNLETSFKRYETTVASAPHNHANHWTAERALTIFLLGSIPAAVIFPHPALEYLMALSLTLHSHWGVEGVVVDYVRPNVVGKFFAKAAMVTVYLLSSLTLCGLFFFIYTDIGIVNAVKMLWSL